MAVSRPLRFYYGWVMLPLSMLALAATSAGQTFGISPFNEALRTSLNLTHSQLASAYMLGTVVGAIPIMWFGHLMDRFGLRTMMLATVTLLSLACLSLAFANNWIMLAVSFCLLRMLGPGVLAMLSGNTLAFWFHRRLGLVESIRKLSIALAMGAVPAVNLWMLTWMDWRDAYFVWSGVVWLGLFPLFALLFRNHPADVGQSFDNSVEETAKDIHLLNSLTLPDALRTRTFWAIIGGNALFAMIMTAIVFNLTPILHEQGLTKWDHARTMTSLAFMMAVSQFVGGMLSDHYSPKPLLLFSQVLFVGALASLLNANSTPMAMLSGGLMGSAQGFFFGVAHPIWARYFGRVHLGKITGFAMSTMVACSSVGPLLAGLIRDWSGTFSMAVMLFAVLPFPVIVLTALSSFTHSEPVSAANYS